MCGGVHALSQPIAGRMAAIAAAGEVPGAGGGRVAYKTDVGARSFGALHSGSVSGERERCYMLLLTAEDRACAASLYGRR